VLARDSRDLREKRGERDRDQFEVPSSKFSELRTQNLELLIAPVAHVSLISLTLLQTRRRPAH